MGPLDRTLSRIMDVTTHPEDYPKKHPREIIYSKAAAVGWAILGVVQRSLIVFPGIVAKAILWTYIKYGDAGQDIKNFYNKYFSEGLIRSVIKAIAAAIGVFFTLVGLYDPSVSFGYHLDMGLIADLRGPVSKNVKVHHAPFGLPNAESENSVSKKSEVSGKEASARKKSSELDEKVKASADEKVKASGESSSAKKSRLAKLKHKKKGTPVKPPKTPLKSPPVEGIPLQMETEEKSSS